MKKKMAEPNQIPKWMLEGLKAAAVIAFAAGGTSAVLIYKVGELKDIVAKQQAQISIMQDENQTYKLETVKVLYEIQTSIDVLYRDLGVKPIR